MKATFVYVPAIALIALLGGMDSGKAADIFQTDDFSGTVNFNDNDALQMPGGPPIFSFDYTGRTTFDETKVSQLPFNPHLGVYNSFLHDGGSLSVTLLLPFAINITFSPTNATMVVEDSKPVGFDFSQTKTVSLPFGETVKLTLNVMAPIPNPVLPGLNPTHYTGVLEDVTLSAVFSGAFGEKESITGTTIPTFTVVPEPGSLPLLCIGTVIVGLAYLRVQRRACFSFSNC
ncbi:MAG: PEP-CTERM sorting domain-containing protein [Verrucomicrobia bacterium]|nr:PEP-CTERM sorting domain-containing protein [Verrucomicrobiota bacterium]